MPARIERPLTQRLIDAALRGNRTTKTFLRDSHTRGFQLIVNQHSAAWMFEFRPRGIDPATGRRYGSLHRRIGDLGTHNLVAARLAASRLRLEVQTHGTLNGTTAPLHD